MLVISPSSAVERLSLSSSVARTIGSSIRKFELSTSSRRRFVSLCGLRRQPLSLQLLLRLRLTNNNSSSTDSSDRINVSASHHARPHISHVSRSLNAIVTYDWLGILALRRGWPLRACNCSCILSSGCLLHRASCGALLVATGGAGWGRHVCREEARERGGEERRGWRRRVVADTRRMSGEGGRLHQLARV